MGWLSISKLDRCVLYCLILVLKPRLTGFQDSQLLTRESSFCTFRPIKMLVCTWNIDAAKPEALVGTNNVTFIQRFLASPALEGAEPDIIVFGFQEVIDLENKKLTASM